MPRQRPKIIPATRRVRKEPVPAASADELVELELDRPHRPQKRSECVEGVRPCPYVSCKHHLYLDVNPETGALRLTFPDLEVHELEETCALDVADREAVTLQEVGRLVNLTRERIRQIEVRGLLALRRHEESLEEPAAHPVPLFDYDD